MRTRSLSFVAFDEMTKSASPLYLRGGFATKQIIAHCLTAIFPLFPLFGDRAGGGIQDNAFNYNAFAKTRMKSESRRMLCMYTVLARDFIRSRELSRADKR